jgi:hypothetical protein
METLDTLARVRLAHPAVDEALAAAAIARFAAMFSNLTVEHVKGECGHVYSDDVFFNDTLKTVRGLDALRHYLMESAANVEDCKVEVQDATRTAQGDWLVRWTMMIRFRKLRRGVDTWTIGMSHLRLAADGRIAYQQDYWNAADGIYEHVPVLGAMIRMLKRRL